MGFAQTLVTLSVELSSEKCALQELGQLTSGLRLSILVGRSS